MAREAQRAQLDDRIEAATAALLGAVLDAQGARERARVVADKVLAEGEAAAVEFERQAARSVRVLRELDLTNAQIAEQCGLSLSVLRGMLSHTRQGASSDAECERE